MRHIDDLFQGQEGYESYGTHKYRRYLHNNVSFLHDIDGHTMSAIYHINKEFKGVNNITADEFIELLTGGDIKRATCYNFFSGNFDMSVRLFNAMNKRAKPISLYWNTIFKGIENVNEYLDGDLFSNSEKLEILKSKYLL